MKTTVVLNQSTEDLKVEGIKINNTTLKQFRTELTKKGFTEVKTIFRGGKHVVTFVTMAVKEIVLADGGLIRGSKKVRTELNKLNNSLDFKGMKKLKYETLGYSF